MLESDLNMPNTKLKVCNFIHQDEIWKDHVRTEHTAEKRWRPRHGYTTDIYDDLEANLTSSNRDLTLAEQLLSKLKSQNNSKNRNHVKSFPKQMRLQTAIMKDADRINDDPVKKQRYQYNRRLVLPPISQSLPPSFTVDKKLLNKVSSNHSLVREGY